MEEYSVVHSVSWQVYLSSVSPACLHNSRERGGWSTPLPPPRRDRGLPREQGSREDRRRSVTRYLPRMHVDHQRPTFSPPNFEVITKRPCCRPVLRPYCRLLFLSFSLSLCSPRLSPCSLLVCLSPVPAGRLSPVPPSPPPPSSFSRHPNQQKSMRRNMRPDTRIFRCTDRTFTFPIFSYCRRVNFKLPSLSKY